MNATQMEAQVAVADDPKVEIVDGIEVVRIPFSGSSRYPIAPGVFRHLKDADLVHVHAIDFFFDALAWGKLLHGKPLVATTHGGFFHTDRYAALKLAWFNVTTRLSALAYRRLIACSAQDARLFRKIAGRRVVEVDNGADVAKFRNAGAGKPLRRIVTIGRFSSNKRLDRLFEALSRLVVHEPDWRLSVVGVPGDLTEADLERMIGQRALEDHIEVHVGLSNEEIRTLISGCSLFASASEYEGFGLTPLEALAAGVPVVALDTAVAREIYGDAVRFVARGDIDGTAAALLELLTSPEAGARLLAHAPRVLSRYSWETAAERTLSAIEAVARR